MHTSTTALIWFHRDLRLADHPALDAALAECERVIPIYIHAPDEEAPWSPGSASNWWLHHSLAALQGKLQRAGSNLLITRGPTRQRLRDLVRQLGATHLFWNRRYEPAIRDRDRLIRQDLTNEGVICRRLPGDLLQEPAGLLTVQGTPYKVFTAYWRGVSERLHDLTPPRPPVEHLPTPPVTYPGIALESLELLPDHPWYRGFENIWQPGEAGAWWVWNQFSQAALNNYADRRDIPGDEGTSRLSPHLHFGEMTPRQIIWERRHPDGLEQTSEDQLECFIRQLGWREFAYYTLYHFPKSAGESLDGRFEKAAWLPTDEQADWLQRWQRGTTGIPIVDAGMRQLWHTGWMPNRVRMIVASLLTKNLGIHWLEGARWFWETLLDADLANNTLGWQWTTGCGVDAAPYFRVFNPARQADRFDPSGRYIKRWVPELAAADKRILHNGRLSIDGGLNYPLPMVDLNQSRKQALLRWEQIKRLKPR
ncbi:cryptochrome/photolyase family protein [Sedimenticola sp.]|uniref:cryptochrome/photolyase family protein n=2 Tax=Sedimenticola sp. TaxID=1940285 RepID=UPI003D0B7F1E